MPAWSDLLADQLDWHWTNQLRPRLDGLTDDEYLWEPVAGCWSVRRGGIDFAFPAPEPAPFTTIAWRMAHVIIGVFAMRNHHHFGGPPADYDSWPYALDAATALRQLDDAYAGWIAGVRGLDESALARPIGAAEGPWAERTMAELVLHIHREAIHHGAEIACLRDLYAHRPDRKD
ncbi:MULTISPECIES: DinB family protein [Mycolicibacter]|uniref:DinB family protein n=1 Tax=Mycolicibacter virginiensis TaxID=1795032 RepID=A0A9X7IPE8_9MYCO|nr:MULTISPECIES: DinB family protein [Mycobacteriaceae]OBG40456.1 serine/arginine repetitive matrix protein 1 [Mycolicibacter heraklionensis]OBJ31321.1 serine/arginine repetitive matrix protein 1 [Mycolicibacter heraklionensis]PQM52969.1 DinB family protein [Mycolicibacter virginiensis]